MSRGALKWGFCSAGKVANDFSVAMDSVMSGKHRKVAVAAKSFERAKKFAEDHNFEKYYGSYEELANDTEVDVVYVSSLNTAHFDLSRMFLEKRKNVVCEKPLTLSFAKTKELVDIAKSAQVFFMEAIWSRCFPLYNQVKKICNEGTIGEVQQIHAHFHLNGAPERVADANLGGGIWFDVGIYCYNLADFIFNEEPTNIQASGYINSGTIGQSADSDAVVNLSYPGGKFAVLTSSFRCRRPNSATICGSNGYIVIKCPFHAPTEFEVFIRDKDKTEVHRHDLGEASGFVYTNSQGFAFEIEHVRDCIQMGLKESPLVPLDVTLRIARVTDGIIEQIHN